MSSTLGEKMREAREERGITISEVAEQTRISPLYIESIEKDDYKPLPGGIFNKGFLKSYARYIGFDEHEALQEYSKLVGSQSANSPEEEFKSYRPEVLTDDRNAASIVPTLIFAGIILALMTGGILVAVSYIRNQPESTAGVPANANINSNTETVLIPNNNLAGTQSTGAPQMETLKLEFATSSGPISISSISDGKSSVLLVTPEKPAMFEPKQSLRLAYSRSLASVARMTINGRSITLPQVPGNPRRAAIEFEINKDNLPQVWQDGGVVAIAPPQSQNSSTPVARPPIRPKVANTAVPRPVATPDAAPRPSPR